MRLRNWMWLVVGLTLVLGPMGLRSPPINKSTNMPHRTAVR